MAAEGAWPYRRELFAHEAASGVDVPSLDHAQTLANEQLRAAWFPMRAQHVAAIVSQVEAAPDDTTDWLAALDLPPLDPTNLAAAIEAAIGDGRMLALYEAASQSPKHAGAAFNGDLPDTQHRVRDYAVAAERLLASGLVQSASREAFRLASAREDAAGHVATILGTEPMIYEKDVLQGMATGAVNEGRYQVMERLMGEPNTGTLEGAEGGHKIYALEILDGNTCDECAAIDGTEYATLEEARIDYPGVGGGYTKCLGRERCRGSIVITLDEDVTPPDLHDAQPLPPTPPPPDIQDISLKPEPFVDADTIVEVKNMLAGGDPNTGNPMTYEQIAAENLITVEQVKSIDQSIGGGASLSVNQISDITDYLNNGDPANGIPLPYSDIAQLTGATEQQIENIDKSLQTQIVQKNAEVPFGLDPATQTAVAEALAGGGSIQDIADNLNLTVTEVAQYKDAIENTPMSSDEFAKFMAKQKQAKLTAEVQANLKKADLMDAISPPNPTPIGLPLPPPEVIQTGTQGMPSTWSQPNSADAQNALGRAGNAQYRLANSAIPGSSTDLGLKALESYKNYGNQQMNPLLRGTYTGPDVAEVQARVDAMKSLYDDPRTSSRLQSDAILYRGMMLPSDQLVAGSVLDDPAFISASVTPEGGAEFARPKRGVEPAPGSEAVVIRMHTPTGTPFLAGNDFEGEMILKPDTKYVIIGKAAESNQIPGGTYSPPQVTTYDAIVLRDGETPEGLMQSIKNANATQASYHLPTISDVSTWGQTNSRDPADVKAIEDARQTISKQRFKNMTTAIRPEGIEALDEYSGNGFGVMNGLLRRNPQYVNYMSDRDTIQTTDRIVAMQKEYADGGLAVPLEKDTRVFRGTTLPEGQVVVGSVVTDAGFLSTSVSEGTASAFPASQAGREEAVIAVHVRAGEKFLPGTQHAHEQEMIFNTGRRILIVGDRGRSSQGYRLLDGIMLKPGEG